MSYYARDDFFNNPEVLNRSVEILKGHLQLDWMKIDVPEAGCRPGDPRPARSRNRCHEMRSGLGQAR